MGHTVLRGGIRVDYREACEYCGLLLADFPTTAAILAGQQEPGNVGHGELRSLLERLCQAEARVRELEAYLTQCRMEGYRI